MKTFLTFLLAIIIGSCTPPATQPTSKRGYFQVKSPCYLVGVKTYGPIKYLPNGMIRFRNTEGDTIVAGGTFWIESFH